MDSFFPLAIVFMVGGIILIVFFVSVFSTMNKRRRR